MKTSKPTIQHLFYVDFYPAYLKAIEAIDQTRPYHEVLSEAQVIYENLCANLNVSVQDMLKEQQQYSFEALANLKEIYKERGW